jgi:alanine-glyoxylate transaminase/serine-glyoxylate transaminase/serine-pyruvate transaminase
MLQANESGFFPYTPATNLLYGLREALQMLEEEGLENVFARHQRLAEASRQAARAWGLEVNPLDGREHSNSLTAVRMPKGSDSDRFMAVTLERYDLSLGQGLGKQKGQLFRIGHLGDFNELMLLGTLAGVEMGLKAAGVPHRPGGVAAAMDSLAATS